MSGDILEQLGLDAPVSEVDRSQVQSQVSIEDKSAKKDPIVEVDEATFAYGRNIILESVEMQIHESEFWCFIGPNGEGKTTLIKALLGALRPKRGLIRLRQDSLEGLVSDLFLRIVI